MSGWLSAFLLTQLVEVPIQAPSVPGSVARRVCVAFGSSAITHPLVWLFVLFGPAGSYDTRVLVAELGAVVVEAAWLRAFGARRPLLVALFANAASIAVGLGSRASFGWP